MELTIKEKIQIELLKELRRREFWEYCLFYDEDFFTKRPFLKLVADAFQELFDNYKRGKAIKVAVSMPPRAGKSYITSLFCSWWIGNNPELSIMRNTCTSRLYSKFSYDVRNIIKGEKFADTFPDIKISIDKQNLDGWNVRTAKQVTYFGAGVGGTIIGFGANLAITDDLYKDIADALSPVVQDGVEVWKQSAHDSRMETNCPEIYIGTRWTIKDEIGKAIESGKIDIEVKIPAMDDKGNSFCENVKTTKEYQKIKDDIDESIWDAEYMQEPAEIKGLLFPKSELKFYDPDKIDLKSIEYKFLYVDPADTGGDDLSAPFAYLIGDKIYITSVVHNQYGTDENLPELVERIIMAKMDSVQVEGNSAWVLFGKELRAKVVNDPEDGGRGYEDCDITIIKNTTNKKTRIIAQASFIKHHILFNKNYEQDKQYKSFIKNLTSYMRDGSSPHDDAPDSLVGVSVFFKNNFSHLW